MVIAATPSYNGVIPSSPPGLSGWWDDVSGAVGDSIGKFSTAAATRIIATPGTTVTSRNADGTSTTISRAGAFNPSPSVGVGVDLPGTSSSTGTILVLGVLAVVMFMAVSRR